LRVEKKEERYKKKDARLKNLEFAFRLGIWNLIFGIYIL